MIWGTNFALSCDVCGARFGDNENQLTLRYEAERAGWALRRRKDGVRAHSGGTDYCPSCKPAGAS